MKKANQIGHQDTFKLRPKSQRNSEDLGIPVFKGGKIPYSPKSKKTDFIPADHTCNYSGAVKISCQTKNTSY